MQRSGRLGQDLCWWHKCVSHHRDAPAPFYSLMHVSPRTRMEGKRLGSTGHSLAVLSYFSQITYWGWDEPWVLPHINDIWEMWSSEGSTTGSFSVESQQEALFEKIWVGALSKLSKNVWKPCTCSILLVVSCKNDRKSHILTCYL